MSLQTRTGPKEVVDVFGVGLAHQVGIALGRHRVTRTELNQIVANPLVGQRVAAAIKGEMTPAVTLDALVARELQLMRDFCTFAQIERLEDGIIEAALVNAQKVWGTVTEHDRFIPEIGLPEGFQFHYGWNTARQAEGLQGLKLCHDPNGEWWRTDKDVQHLPTTTGVIRCNVATVMEWTDLEGRPFNLTYDDHMSWGSEQGGDGITSAAENAYLNARSLMERGLPLIPLGSLRCQNRCGAGGSLSVGCDAGDGFYVGYWSRDDRRWFLGAVSRKFVALGN